MRKSQRLVINFIIMAQVQSNPSKKISKASSNPQLFLQNILTNLLIRQISYDGRAIVLLGIDSIVFVFSLSNLIGIGIQGGTIASLTICFFSLISAVFALCTLSPPEIFISREDSEESVMHHSNINTFTPKQFNDLLKKVTASKDNVFEQYTRAIYNITTKSVMKKKYFIALASYFLIIGLVLGLVLLFYLP